MRKGNCFRGWLILLCCVMLSSGAAIGYAEEPIPVLAGIPSGLSAAQRARLAAQKERLEGELNRFMAAANSFNEKAASAQTDQEYAALQAQRARYVQSATDYNSMVDSGVVDARNVPSGLPKSVEEQIPRTPAGERVRKGFQAIANHDWTLAQAWFQDALLHDPGNAGIQRLVDLASFTLAWESGGTPVTGMDATQKRAKPTVEPEAVNKDVAAYATRHRLDEQAIAILQRELDQQTIDELELRLRQGFDREFDLLVIEHARQWRPVPHSGTSAPVDEKVSAPATDAASWKSFFRELFAPLERGHAVGAPRG